MSADRGAALAFLAFSVALGAGSWALPDGAGRIPGPAFFPLAIAAAVAALSISLLWQARRPLAPSPSAPSATKRVAGVAALLLVYLSLWGTGLFALRTTVFLCLMLRFTGQAWKTSAAVAAALAVLVVLAFQGGLKVSLD